jgi:uncharacterized protein
MYTIDFYKNKSSIEGFGVFAGEFVPVGTIVYYCGSGDKIISKNEFQSLPKQKKEHLFINGAEDEAGNWLVTDGDANHSCDSNILSIFVDSIYCDIAIKDIDKDEEITLDYGLLYSSFPWRMECKCGSPNCRKIIELGRPVDLQTQYLWFSKISDASRRIFNVKQKLFYMEDEKAKALTESIKSRPNPVVFPYVKFTLVS